MSIHQYIDSVRVDEIPAPFRNLAGIYAFLDLRKSSQLATDLCNAAPLSTHTYLLTKELDKLTDRQDQHTWLANLVARLRADGFTEGNEKQKLFYEFLTGTLSTVAAAPGNRE